MEGKLRLVRTQNLVRGIGAPCRDSIGKKKEGNNNRLDGDMQRMLFQRAEVHHGPSGNPLVFCSPMNSYNM
jgi:hypothetical protein